MSKFSKKTPDIPKKKESEKQYISRNGSRLIDLDREYHFLKDASKVVDLCAAPGGWSNVLYKKIFLLEAKEEEEKLVDSNIRVKTNENADIVAVDVKEMESVPEVTFIKGDLREKKTIKAIIRHFKRDKVDLVLFDGELESVGSLQNDILNHGELFLGAILTAFSVLRLRGQDCEFPGGTFVAKILRENEDCFSIRKQLLSFFDTVDIKTFKAFTDSSFRKYGKEEYVVCCNFQLPANFDLKDLPPYFDQKDRHFPIHYFKKMFDNLGELCSGLGVSQTDIEAIDAKWLANPNLEESEEDNSPTEMSGHIGLPISRMPYEARIAEWLDNENFEESEKDGTTRAPLLCVAKPSQQMKSHDEAASQKSKQVERTVEGSTQKTESVIRSDKSSQQIKCRSGAASQKNQKLRSAVEDLSQILESQQIKSQDEAASQKSEQIEKPVEGSTQKTESVFRSDESSQQIKYQSGAASQKNQKLKSAVNSSQKLESQQMKSQDKAASQKTEQIERRVDGSSQKTESVIKSDKSSQQITCQSGNASQKNQKLESAVEDSSQKLETQTFSLFPKTK